MGAIVSTLYITSPWIFAIQINSVKPLWPPSHECFPMPLKLMNSYSINKGHHHYFKGHYYILYTTKGHYILLKVTITS